MAHPAWAARRDRPGEAFPLWWLVGLPLLLPTASVTARRLRDAGLSPWFVLLHVLPPFGTIVVLTMCGFSSRQPSPAAAAGRRRSLPGRPGPAVVDKQDAGHA